MSAATDTQKERPAAHCGLCRGEMYPKEPLFCWEGRKLCGACFADAVRAWAEEAPGELALALGIAVERAAQ